MVATASLATAAYKCRTRTSASGADKVAGKPFDIWVENILYRETRNYKR